MAVALAVLSQLRRAPQTAWSRALRRVSPHGLCRPGSVIAVGVLIPLGWLDTGQSALRASASASRPGLILTGTMVALVYAYVVRFLAVSFNTVEASLGKVTPHGCGLAHPRPDRRALRCARAHADHARQPVRAGILVFVDVMKELPATVILRPFDFDTLAVRAYELASDERLAQASTSALAIVAVGIIPVILLSIAMPLAPGTFRGRIAMTGAGFSVRGERRRPATGRGPASTGWFSGGRNTPGIREWPWISCRRWRRARTGEAGSCGPSSR
jgi:iron(III) transport system permease protein